MTTSGARSGGTLNLSEALSPDRIALLPPCTKDEALRSLVDLVNRSGLVRDPKALSHAVMAREVMMSTGIGYGVAIPHAKIPGIDRFLLALGISRKGISYGSLLDDLPVKLICLIAGPSDDQGGYLALLSLVSKFLKSEKGKILASATPADIHKFTLPYSRERAIPSP